MSTLFAIIIGYFLLKWFFKSNDNSGYKSTYNPPRSNTPSTNTSRATPSTNTSRATTNSNNRSSIPISPVVSVNPPNRFTPNSTRFIAEINTGQYKYYYLYDYFPVSRFNHLQLSTLQINHRHRIYEFKDGRNPQLYAELFASAFINKFGLSNLGDYTVLIIPASTIQNTRNRFELFLYKFCQNTGAINGFNMLKNSPTERNPQHNGGTRISLENITFEGDFTGKKFIIIDDVRTRGSSSQLIYSELRRLNADEIIFCYLGRTVPLDYTARNNTSNSIRPSNSNEEEFDDLPF